ncbi:MAG: NUDIX hydrolase [Dehalococcoidales bacterium]
MEAELKNVLAQRTKHYITDKNRRPSAVLIPIYKNEGQYHIVFIKRTKTVKTHKGQISFPGGMRDKGDATLRETALRESTEEIGLRNEDATILGELDDQITTTSNFIVTPFVAMIPWPYRFKPNKAEVAKIITVPILALLAEGCRRPYIEETIDGKTEKSFAYYYQGTIIWGATARILNKLLEIIEQIPLD